MPDVFSRALKCFSEALQLEGDSQGQFLKEAGAQDPALRKELERLLANHRKASGINFLHTPLSLSSVFAESGLTVGESIGPYKIIRPIGSGGMGNVYLAHDTAQVAEPVAIKVIKSGNTTDHVSRFEAERVALARMNHPNVARAIDAGATKDGRLYFVMEYVPGDHITAFCDKHCLSIRERLKLFPKVCDAIDHAHGKGIIHRDIKPSNVLVAGESGNPIVKVIDFGVARITDEPLTDRTFFTDQGQMVGTPGFMSPEQVTGRRDEIDQRTDVYSLGVLLYELLLDQHPLDPQMSQCRSWGDIQRVILEVDPIWPSRRATRLGNGSATISKERGSTTLQLRKELRGHLDTIVIHALERERERRYRSAAEFGADVLRYLENKPPIAPRQTIRYRARKFARRRRMALITAGLAAGLFTAVAFGAYSWRESKLASVERSWSEAQLAKFSSPGESIIKLHRFIGEYPEHIPARVELASALAIEGRHLEAIDQAESVLIDSPDCGPAHLLLGMLLQKRQPQKSSFHLERGLGLVPNDLYLQAEVRPASEAEQAIELLTRHLQKHGMDFSARWSRAWRYDQVGQYEKMLEDARILIANRADAPAGYNVYGMALFRLERPDEAAKEFSRAIERGPNYASSYLNRAMAYRDMGRSGLALADCAAAIRIEPTLSTAYAVRASVYLKMGQLEKALADCQKSLEIEPDNSSAYVNRGVIWASQKKWSQALDDFNHAIEREPGNTKLRFHRAETYRALGQHVEAIEDYDVFINFDSQEAAFFGRGRSRLQSGDLNGALADFSEGICLDPTGFRNYHYRARVYLRKSDLTNAILDHDQAIELASDPAELRMLFSSRAISHWLNGNLGTAIFDLQQAIDQEPAKGGYYELLLWQIHSLQNNSVEAASSLQRAEQSENPFIGHLVRLLRSQANVDDILPFGEDNEERAFAFYYAGVKVLIEGRHEESASWFKRFCDLKYTQYLEYSLAQAYLQTTLAPFSGIAN